MVKRLSLPVVRFGLAILLCLGWSLPHAAVGMDEISDYSARIQYAVYEGDARTLRQIAQDLAAARATAGHEPLVHYYAAYAAYRAAELTIRRGGDDTSFLVLCEEQALAATAVDEAFADAWALAGACAALEAATNVAALLSARQATRYLQRAATLEPGNPRVALLRAISLLRRPSLTDAWGAPEALLEEAGHLFSVAPVPLRGEPDWGEAETSALRAELAMEAGRHMVARDAAEHSLLLAPDYHRPMVIMQRLRASSH